MIRPLCSLLFFDRLEYKKRVEWEVFESLKMFLVLLFSTILAVALVHQWKARKQLPRGWWTRKRHFPCSFRENLDFLRAFLIEQALSRSNLILFHFRTVPSSTHWKSSSTSLLLLEERRNRRRLRWDWEVFRQSIHSLDRSPPNCFHFGLWSGTWNTC